MFLSRLFCSANFSASKNENSRVIFDIFSSRPYTGCYNKFYEKGTYTCVVCEQELFSSDTKYDSGCGWPAFNEVLDQGRVKLTKDTTNGKPFFSFLFAAVFFNFSN